MSAMPAPKKAPAKKKAAEAPKPVAEAAEEKKGEDGQPIKPVEEVKKPARVKKPPPPMMPIHEPLPKPADLSVD